MNRITNALSAVRASLFGGQSGIDPVEWSHGRVKEVEGRSSPRQTGGQESSFALSAADREQFERTQRIANNYAPAEGHPDVEVIREWSTDELLDYLADYNAAARVSLPDDQPADGTHLDIWYSDSKTRGGLVLKHEISDTIGRYEHVSDDALDEIFDEADLEGILPYPETAFGSAPK